jgi:hypothetical protein
MDNPTLKLVQSHNVDWLMVAKLSILEQWLQCISDDGDGDDVVADADDE